MLEPIARVGQHSPSLTVFEGLGYALRFQDGPIQEFGVNGTTNEAIITLLITRLNSLNQPPFHCRDNDLAIANLSQALFWLTRRTEERVRRGVEGTNTP